MSYFLEYLRATPKPQAELQYHMTSTGPQRFSPNTRHDAIMPSDEQTYFMSGKKLSFAPHPLCQRSSPEKI